MREGIKLTQVKVKPSIGRYRIVNTACVITLDRDFTGAIIAGIPPNLGGNCSGAFFFRGHIAVGINDCDLFIAAGPTKLVVIP